MAQRVRHTTGTAWLVENALWRILPAQMQLGALEGFALAYTFQGGHHMALKRVAPERVPQRLDFTDGIVELHRTGDGAARALSRVVRKQLAQVPGYREPFPERPYAGAVDLGRAFVLKDERPGLAALGEEVLCIAECVVNFETVVGMWRLQTKKDRSKGVFLGPRLRRGMAQPTSTLWPHRIPRSWQRWLGVALGRVMAHEVWHLLYARAIEDAAYRAASPWGKRHLGRDGLEADGGGSHWTEEWPLAGFGEEGRAWVTKSLPKLDALQGTRQSHALLRR